MANPGACSFMVLFDHSALGQSLLTTTRSAVTCATTTVPRGVAILSTTVATTLSNTTVTTSVSGAVCSTTATVGNPSFLADPQNVVASDASARRHTVEFDASRSLDTAMEMSTASLPSPLGGKSDHWRTFFFRILFRIYVGSMCLMRNSI